MAPRRAARFVFCASLALAIAPSPGAQEPQPAARPGEHWLRLPANTGYAHPEPSAIHRDITGPVSWCAGELRFYVHFARTGALGLVLLRSPVDRAAPVTNLVTIQSMPDGRATPATQQQISHVTRRGRPHEPLQSSIGYQATVTTAGYHCITVRTSDGSDLGTVYELTLGGEAAQGAHASTVERRNAASVHLGYDVPVAHRDDIEWFYCEITPRTDPLWTYYMATGWHRGYFGMQVNSPAERRLIFSVWDSGSEAVDRDKVAAEDQVTLVAKGDGVVATGFGHEGTGGHSHLVHDWQLGGTFRFLVHARAAGTHTTYTGWFWSADAGRWQLIASFRAPKDGGLLHGLHSFNENFAGENGDALRDCEFGNVWARTIAGEWLPLTSARFTHDGHGEAQRLDRSAGVRGARFYLQNGGFVLPAAGAVERAGAVLSLPKPDGSPPDADTLPTPPTDSGGSGPR